MTKEELQQAIDKEKIKENLDANLLSSLQQMMDNGEYEADGTPPVCPKGQVWNGTQCVPDVG